MDVKTFEKLFVHNDSAYAEQDKDSRSYKTHHKKLTRKIIQEHLDGTRTIGLYQVRDRTIKWFCIDIDIIHEIHTKPDFKYEDYQDIVEQQMMLWKDALGAEGITCYVETSGNKGLHIWGFFKEAIGIKPVKDYLDNISKQIPKLDGLNWDLYPYSYDQGSDNVGKPLKGPCGYHQYGGKMSEFYGDLTLENVKYIDPSIIVKSAASGPLDAIFNNCNALENLLKKGIDTGHLTHEERKAIGMTFAPIDEEKEEHVFDYLIDRVFRHLGDYNKTVTLKNLSDFRRNYLPRTCTSLQSVGICEKTCDAILQTGKKSPVVFYYRSAGKDEKNLDKKIINKEDASYDFEKFGILEDNSGYFVQTKDGIKIISNFIFKPVETVEIDNGFEVKYIYKLKIVKENGKEALLEIPAKDWRNVDRTRSAVNEVLGLGGINYVDFSQVMTAADNTFPEMPRRVIQQIFGYIEDEKGVPIKYQTPSIIITKDIIKDNDEIEVNLENCGEAEYLDMCILSDEEYYNLVNHIKSDFLEIHPKISPTSLAFTVLPLIHPYLGVKNKFFYHLRGLTGSGKSFMAELCQHFYGEFKEVTSWTSTTKSIQAIGSYFRNCLQVADDYKIRNLDNKVDPLKIIQNYADNTGRARLKRDASIGTKYIIKSHLYLTGEDKIEGEASVLARAISFVKHRATEREIQFGNKCKKMKHLYKGFLPRVIKDILSLNDPYNYFEDYRKQIEPLFFKKIENMNNNIRIAENYSMLSTAGWYLAKFLYNTKEEQDKFVDNLNNILLENCLVTAKEVNDERAGEIFYSYLCELLSTNEVRLQSDSLSDFDSDTISKNKPIIGFYDEQKYPIIIIRQAYEVVEKAIRRSGNTLAHSSTDIIEQLIADGRVLDTKETVRRLNGKRVKTLKFKKFDNDN